MKDMNNLDKFLTPEEIEKIKKEQQKKVLSNKNELVEKVDKRLVMEDGRDLLREITYKF
jgi:hypothetical protein